MPAMPIDDIHTPSVVSGPVSGGYTNGAAKDDLTFDQLVAEKESLEEKLKALSAVLDSV